MSETITSALITGGVAILVCCISNIFQSQAQKDQHDKTVALIEYRLEELTKKVEKHNNLVERFATLEQSVNTAWKRLDEIKTELEKLR